MLAISVFETCHRQFMEVVRCRVPRRMGLSLGKGRETWGKKAGPAGPTELTRQELPSSEAAESPSVLQRR